MHTKYKIQKSKYELQITNYILQITEYQSLITKYKLQENNYIIRITNCKLQITNYTFELQITELPTTNHKNQITNYKSQNGGIQITKYWNTKYQLQIVMFKYKILITKCKLQNTNDMIKMQMQLTNYTLRIIR